MESTFGQRLELVNGRIAEACRRAGRDPAGVRLVAVAKTFGPNEVAEAANNGLKVIGESKVQEARQKIPLCPSGIEWHMVGHLQTNKVKDAVRLFRMVHSVDSLKLLETLNSACSAAGIEMPVCLEVNVSGERSKFGMPPEEAPAVLEKAGSLMSVSVQGLMTVPPFLPLPEDARPFFRKLRELRDQWKKQTGFPLDELSMGMSHDFDVAVEEGSTMVRIGSLLFGDRPKRRQIVENEP
jgi:PLP dependent protein